MGSRFFVSMTSVSYRFVSALFRKEMQSVATILPSQNLEIKAGFGVSNI